MFRISLWSKIIPVYRFSEQKFPPYNINIQENQSFLKKVEKAKLSQQQPAQTKIPRRKRRLYDRPRFDFDITKYKCWRLLHPDQYYIKQWEHQEPVVAKIDIQPKWLIHAFGQPCLATCNKKSSSGEYVFQDNNLSKFLLYEYRETTHYKANDPDWDYHNQENMLPKMRKKYRITPQQFWKSEEYYPFRLNASYWAESQKFKKWIQAFVEQSKSKKSYDNFIDEKFGRVNSFSQKQGLKQFVPYKPYVTSAGPNHFSQDKKLQTEEVKVEIEKQLGEQFRISLKETKEASYKKGNI